MFFSFFQKSVKCFKKTKIQTQQSNSLYKDKLTGTARYVSTNCHDGIENSRRDDLESTGYVLLYFELGKLGGLPWQHLKATSKRQKHEKIANIKSSLTPKQMCEKCRVNNGSKNIGPVLEQYLKYCRDLVFDDEPDYIFLRSLFRGTGVVFDCNYDWFKSLSPDFSKPKYGFEMDSGGGMKSGVKTPSFKEANSLNSNSYFNSKNPRPRRRPKVVFD